MGCRGPAGLVTAVLALTVVLAACSAGQDTAQDTPTAPTAGDESEPSAPAEATTAPATGRRVTGGAVTLALSQDEGSLTPYTYVTGTGWYVLHLVYDSLLVLDENNEPQPLLASDMSVSDDGLVYEFTLREDVVWHDGEPFTADDVVFTFDYAGENQHVRWTPAVAGVESVEAPDEQTVVITLSKADPTFLIRPLADMPIFPRHIWEGNDDPEAAGLADAVGTGPYRLVEYETDQRYRLEANADYTPLGTPTIDELNIVVVPEKATQFASLRTGDVDIAYEDLEGPLVEQFRDADDLGVAQGPGFRSELLQFNTEFPPLDQAAVRRAIGDAIDLDELVEVVLLGLGTVGTDGYAHPDSPLAVDPIAHSFDPDASDQALDALGYTPGEDGIRVADGRRMSFQLLVDASDPTRLRAAELITEMLAEIGVETVVEGLERTTVTDMVWPDFDVSQGRDFEMAMWGWSSPVMLDPFRLGSLVHSDPERGSINIGGLVAPGLDAIVNEFDETADPARREDLLQQTQEGIAEQRPFQTLMYPDLIQGYRPDAYDGWVIQTGQGVVQKLSLAQLDI